MLLPHLEDSYWAGVDYGVVAEARRLGLAVTIFEAGGYDNLPKQVSQYDDCIASKPDAIIVGPISEAGLSAKLKEAADKGIPTIVFIHPVNDAPVTAKIFVEIPERFLIAKVEQLWR